MSDLRGDPDLRGVQIRDVQVPLKSDQSDGARFAAAQERHELMVGLIGQLNYNILSLAMSTTALLARAATEPDAEQILLNDADDVRQAAEELAAYLERLVAVRVGEG